MSERTLLDVILQRPKNEPGDEVADMLREVREDDEAVIPVRRASPLPEEGSDEAEWLKRNGDVASRAIIELLHAFGCRLPTYNERPCRKVTVTAVKPRGNPQERCQRSATLTLTRCMRYVAAECSPGKSDGKASRPRTRPRNGSHYVSTSRGGEAPGWHNLVRAYEERHDPTS